MTYATFRAAAEHIARAGTITPHQLAAWEAAWRSASDAQRREFTELWRAQGSPAAPPPPAEPAWLAPALKIIKEYEGCHLDAYLCPAGVPTIGWGATRLIDRPVQLGDRISQEMADDLLRNDVEMRHRRLVELLPLPIAQRLIQRLQGGQLVRGDGAHPGEVFAGGADGCVGH